MIDPATLPPTHGPGDPRGVLTFVRPIPEPWQTLEDSTQAADFDRSWALGARFHRPATETERALLTALGYRDGRGHPPGGDLMTRVHVGGGVRTRTWPTLTIPTPPTAPAVPPPAPEPTPDPTPTEPDATTEPITPTESETTS